MPVVFLVVLARFAVLFCKPARDPGFLGDDPAPVDPQASVPDIVHHAIEMVAVEEEILHPNNDIHAHPGIEDEVEIGVVVMALAVAMGGGVRRRPCFVDHHLARRRAAVTLATV